MFIIGREDELRFPNATVMESLSEYDISGDNEGTHTYNDDMNGTGNDQDNSKDRV